MNGLTVIAGLSSKIHWLPKKPNKPASQRLPFGRWAPKFSHDGLGPSLGRSGSLELRLATKKSEIRKAQRLRFKVFFEEGGAAAEGAAAIVRRDICPFDKVCDHLLVIDHATRNRFGKLKPRVVGAYRLLRQDVAQANFGFYSAQEFDIGPLLAGTQSRGFSNWDAPASWPITEAKKPLKCFGEASGLCQTLSH